MPALFRRGDVVLIWLSADRFMRTLIEQETAAELTTMCGATWNSQGELLRDCQGNAPDQPMSFPHLTPDPCGANPRARRYAKTLAKDRWPNAMRNVLVQKHM